MPPIFPRHAAGTRLCSMSRLAIATMSRIAIAIPIGLLALAAPRLSHAATATRARGPAEITVYNADLALVREPYTLSLSRGRNVVTIEGLPRMIDSTSVRLEGSGFRVLRQSFDYDLWSGDRVFRRFLGDSIVYRYAGRTFHGRLAGIEGDDLFIERRDSVGVLTMVKRFQVSEIEFPTRLGLKTSPSLTWEIESQKGGETSASLSYLTSGMQWTAEYSAVLDQDEHAVELMGWGSIVNQAGVSFPNAEVSLVAGEIHRARQATERGVTAEESSQRAPERSAPDLFAYHVYRVPGGIELSHLETTQVPIVGPVRVPARRAYVYDAARDGSRVRVRVELGNEKAAGLGVPLPEGRVRVYKPDASGARTLIGEDAIDQVAPGEKIHLLTGTAFDLVADRRRTSHTRVSRNVTEDQYTITVRNRGGTTAPVTIQETLYGNWEIPAKTVEFRKKDAETIEFEVTVPAGGVSEVKYTVRFTY